MGMVVKQPCILVSKLKKTKTRFLRNTGYLNSIKIYKARFITNSSSCTTTELSKFQPHVLLLSNVKNLLLSTAKRYMKDLVRM